MNHAAKEVKFDNFSRFCSSFILFLSLVKIVVQKDKYSGRVNFFQLFEAQHNTSERDLKTI